MKTPDPTVRADSGERDEPHVLVIAGDRSFRRTLDRGNRTVIIGRGEDCDLRIDDGSVSRRHARLDLDGRGATIQDLASHNGTRLNGEPLAEPRRLSSGDVVSVGEAVVVVYLPRRAAFTAGLAREIVDRLEAEVDRAVRYDRTLAVIAWDAAAPAAVLTSLLAPLVRRCDAVGVGPDGNLLGVFPELDGAQAEALARRSVELDAGIARAGIALCPTDGADAPSLLSAVRDALAAAPARGVGSADGAARRVQIGDRNLVLADPGMIQAYDLLRRLAPSDLPVLVTGETGAGKELAAHALHHWSRRAPGPFVAVNCAALPENLVESELFGHRKGSFTGADRDKPGFFERAAGGTLFLDEIADLPLAAQAKLLRAVDTRQVTRVGDTDPTAVDVRFVAATNRDLAAEVAAERFRADLMYRLSAAVVALPPLRDRPREIPLLARAFLARARERLGRPPLELSDGALRILGERRYPGNVRELGNALEYAAAVASAGDDGRVEPWHLPAEMSPGAPPEAAVRFRPIDEEVAELERRRMLEALKASGGNQSRAADLIQMPRRTFVTKMGKYNLR
jgi:two-component system response regulator AtoC